MKFRAFLTIQEATYAGNIGFSEMVRFYRKATDNEIDEMEKHISNGNWHGFRAMIKKVLGIDLEEARKYKSYDATLSYQGDTIVMLKSDDDEEEEE